MKKVNAFKQQLSRGKNKLLYAEFNESDDFPSTLSHDLEPWLNDPRQPWNIHRERPVSTLSASQPVDPNARQWLDAYYQALRRECENLPLEKLGEGNVAIHLSQVHIPLKIRRPPPRPEIDDPETLRRHALRLERGEGEDDDEMPLLEMLAEQRLAVLVGGPGSGKSALVNWVSSRLLHPETDDKDASLPPPLRDLLPVRLVLRRAPNVDREENSDWVWQALEADIEEKLKPQGGKDSSARAKAAAALLRARTERGPGLLFLLDGLDEVTAAGEQRERVIRVVRNFTDTLPAHCRLLLTARPYAYTDKTWRLPGVPDYVLAPMDKELRAAFMHRWHEVGGQHKGWTEDEAGKRAKKLIHTVETSPHLKELARRPLHATLIALLSLRGRLPHDRAELYENAIELLIDRWRSGESAFRGRDNEIVDIPEHRLRKALEQLAWEVHRDQRREDNHEDAADISPRRLDAVLAPVLKQERVCFNDLLVWLRDHTGILAARDENHFAFPHRAFQEHLAMCWLARQSTEAPVAGQVGEDPLWWREVFLLAVASERKTPRNGVQHVTELLDLDIGDPARRARARHRLNPDNRYDVLGFRVLSESPILKAGR